jgi:hypothetical protein
MGLKIVKRRTHACATRWIHKNVFLISYQNASYTVRTWMALDQEALGELLLSCNWTDSALLGALYTRMRNNFVLVMPHCCLGNRAHVALLCLEHVRVVGRQHCRRSAYNGTQSIVHSLGLRLVDDIVLERGTLGCSCFVGRDRGMRVQIVVVVSCCTYDGASLPILAEVY